MYRHYKIIYLYLVNLVLLNTSLVMRFEIVIKRVTGNSETVFSTVHYYSIQMSKRINNI